MYRLLLRKLSGEQAPEDLALLSNSDAAAERDPFSFSFCAMDVLAAGDQDLFS